MLYDILFIDDDFGETSDAKEWKENATKLFFEFIKENIRVTYTTGEIDDLEKLSYKDLSSIKYVFCDLHLEGITHNDGYKKINGKLTTIFQKLDENIESKQVKVLINSKYIKLDAYSDSGKKDLQKKLNDIKSYKYKVSGFEIKNNIGEYKEELLRNHLDLHIKSFIIAKSIELENELNEKLSLSTTSREKLDLYHKYLVFQSQFCLKNDIKNKINLLIRIRNKAAHTNNQFQEITTEEFKEIFRRIMVNLEREQGIQFNSFEDLITYIKSIDELKKTVAAIKNT